MKYFIRAVKYFVYFAVILTIILSVLALLGVIDSSIETMFKDGYKSLWKIAACLAAISAVYPSFGYTRRIVHIGEDRDRIINFMSSKDYIIEKKEEGVMTFRCSSSFRRLSRMWEDRITLTKEVSGFEMEGYSKDVMRLASGLEYHFKEED